MARPTITRHQRHLALSGLKQAPVVRLEKVKATKHHAAGVKRVPTKSAQTIRYESLAQHHKKVHEGLFALRIKGVESTAMKKAIAKAAATRRAKTVKRKRDKNGRFI